MKKLISIFLVNILILSCGVDREKYSEELIDNLDYLKELLQYIETNYSDVINSKSTRNRVVFANCNDLGYSSEDYICDFPKVLIKMNKLNISEIRFEKGLDKCDPTKGFTEVYFKRNRKKLDPVINYLYEYCGSKDTYESRAIYYGPVDDFFGLLIDTSIP